METQQLENQEVKEQGIEIFDSKLIAKKLTEGQVVYNAKIKEVAQLEERLDVINLDDIDTSSSEGKELMDEVWDISRKFLKIRTSADKEGQDLRRPVNEVASKIKSVYDGFNGKVKKAEAHPTILKLLAIYKKIEDDAILAKEAKEKLIDDRVNTLIDLSFEFSEKGYYTNNRGQSFDRMAVSQMSDADYLSFLGVAQSTHEVIEKERIDREFKETQIQIRKENISKLGLQCIDGVVNILDLSGGVNKTFQIDFSDDNRFVNEFQKIKELLADNATYSENFKKHQAEQEAKAKEQEAEQRRLADERSKVSQDKIRLYANKLNEVGFRFIMAQVLEDSYFEYTSKKGNLKVNSNDILTLDADTIVSNAITQAQGYNKEIADEIEAEKQKQIAETQRLEREKQAQLEAQEKDLQEKLKLAQEEESKKKRKVSPSLKKIDTAISNIKAQCIIDDLDPIVEPYFNSFLGYFTNLVEGFQDKIKHLR